jgi:hypothetical protein
MACSFREKATEPRTGLRRAGPETVPALPVPSPGRHNLDDQPFDHSQGVETTGDGSITT